MLTKQLIEQKKKDAEKMIGAKREYVLQGKAISIDTEKKTATFVMSTANVDRHGDIIDQKSWIMDYFLKSPMFFLNHASDQFPIGKWIKTWFEADPENPGQDRMVGTAEFRTEFEDAARAFVHVENGDLTSVSVGFIPHRVEYDESMDAFKLYDCELLECSLVGVPSNRQAIIRDAKEEAIEKGIEFTEAIDKAMKVRENNNVIAYLKSREAAQKALRQLSRN